MESSVQIQYDGEWPAAERVIVESAVKAVGVGKAPHTVGPEAPWILIRRDVGGGQMYLASYIDVENIVTGRSPEALARGIRRHL